MPKLDQLATRYADLIRHLRPDGPHHLIGWDHGGVVAFEVARQLKRAHIEVSSLILLDSCNPMAYEHPHHIDEAQLLDAFVQDLAGFSGVTLPVCADLFRRLSSQQARLEKAFELFGQFPHILMQKEQFEARYQSYKMNVSTTLKYWPKPFDGKLTLFRSSSAQSYDRSPTADLGWQKFAAKGVEVINIAAGHYGMLKNQAAKQIAEHIQLC
jgi:thioesterase domain-containing protein